MYLILSLATSDVVTDLCSSAGSLRLHSDPQRDYEPLCACRNNGSGKLSHRCGMLSYRDTDTAGILRPFNTHASR